jgi:hypothetical protein
MLSLIDSRIGAPECGVELVDACREGAGARMLTHSHPGPCNRCGTVMATHLTLWNRL